MSISNLGGIEEEELEEGEIELELEEGESKKDKLDAIRRAYEQEIKMLEEETIKKEKEKEKREQSNVSLKENDNIKSAISIFKRNDTGDYNYGSNYENLFDRLTVDILNKIDQIINENKSYNFLLIDLSNIINNIGVIVPSIVTNLTLDNNFDIKYYTSYIYDNDYVTINFKQRCYNELISVLFKNNISDKITIKSDFDKYIKIITNVEFTYNQNIQHDISYSNNNIMINIKLPNIYKSYKEYDDYLLIIIYEYLSLINKQASILSGDNFKHYRRHLNKSSINFIYKNLNSCKDKIINIKDVKEFTYKKPNELIRFNYTEVDDPSGHSRMDKIYKIPKLNGKLSNHENAKCKEFVQNFNDIINCKKDFIDNECLE